MPARQRLLRRSFHHRLVFLGRTTPDYCCVAVYQCAFLPARRYPEFHTHLRVSSISAFCATLISLALAHLFAAASTGFTGFAGSASHTLPASRVRSACRTKFFLRTLSCTNVRMVLVPPAGSLRSRCARTVSLSHHTSVPARAVTRFCALRCSSRCLGSFSFDFLDDVYILRSPTRRSLRTFACVRPRVFPARSLRVANTASSTYFRVILRTRGTRALPLPFSLPTATPVLGRVVRGASHVLVLLRVRLPRSAFLRYAVRLRRVTSPFWTFATLPHSAVRSFSFPFCAFSAPAL